jgi:hypothetical protein
MRDFYSQHNVESDAASRGTQLTISHLDNSDPHLTISFYPGTSKIMIQPGQKDEANLLMWLDTAFSTLSEYEECSFP